MGSGKLYVAPEVERLCQCWALKLLRQDQRPSWGCQWYRDWKLNVQKARDLKQKLKVVFFHGQVGKGKVDWDLLSTEDLWNGVGCGTSQKGEIATLDAEGWKYESVDVLNLLVDEFREGCEVHARDLKSHEWKKGVIDKFIGTSDSGLLSWLVKAETGEMFESQHLVHLHDPQDASPLKLGRDTLLETLKRAVPEGVEVEEGIAVEEQRLRHGALAVYIQVRAGIKGFQMLRDQVLSGDLEMRINQELQAKEALQLQVSKTEFFRHFEHAMMRRLALTEHQKQKLSDMAELQDQDLHLSGPAGSGKTLVAVKHVLQILSANSDGWVLYIATSKALGLYFVTWMLTAMPRRDRAQMERLLCRIRVQFVEDRHTPDESILLIPKLGDKTVKLLPEPDTEVPKGLLLAVFDEAHITFTKAHCDAAMQSLLLSDLSQSAELEHEFPDMTRIKLTEVVRCCKRIVAGATAFECLGVFFSLGFRKVVSFTSQRSMSPCVCQRGTHQSRKR